MWKRIIYLGVSHRICRKLVNLHHSLTASFLQGFKKEGKGWNQDTHMIKQRKYVFPWTLIKTNTNYCQKHCTWKIIEVIYLWLGYIKSWLCRRRSRNIYILFLYIPSTVLPSSCPNENIAQILALSSWRWSFTKGKWTFTTIVHTTN